MSEDPGEAAITDGISGFSFANQEQIEPWRQPASGLHLSRKLASRSSPSIDITSNFRHAADQLKPGELIKDEFFTLFEAVGALEIMDAKMDSGYLGPGESLEDDYDVSRPIQPEELIGILDALLCLQVAWQTGYPLPQTVFASVYIENMLWPEPRTLEEVTFRSASGTFGLSLCQRALRVYCLLLIKSCDFIYNRISEETYYEEEDFFTQLYNRTLLTAFPHEQILSLAADLLETLAIDNSISQIQRQAIVSRLEMQCSFLKAAQDAMEATPQAGLISWQKLLDQIQPVQESHKLGKPVVSAISSKIQRKLASSVPPRPVVELGFAAAIEFMKRLCTDATLLGQLSKCDDLSTVVTFVSYFQAQHPQPTIYMRCLLQRFILYKFAYLEEPSPSEFAKREIFGEVTRLVHPDKQLIEAAEDDSIDSKDEWTHERLEIFTAIHRFTDMVAKPLWGYIRALTMNRSRTRRMLCHMAMEWDVVQLELEDLDADMRQYTGEQPVETRGDTLWEYPLSSWAYDIKLRQLMLVQFLGFELEIYQQEELSTSYWALQWISSVRQGQLERIALFVKARADKLDRPTRTELEAISTTLMTLQYETNYVTAVAFLAQSLAVLYRALVVLGLLPPPRQLPYSTDSLRHHLRTRPFHNMLQPPLPDATEEETIRTSFYKHNLLYASRNNRNIPSRQHLPLNLEEALALLDDVDKTAKHARQAWDQVAHANPSIARAEACETAWRNDIKNVQKSTIAVGLVSATVRKWIEKGAREGELEAKVEMGHDAGLYHVSWVVPKVKHKS